MTSLTTPAQIDAYRCSVICRAIGLYLKTGMQVNRMYTPKAMRSVASEYTGVGYARSRKGLEAAHADLTVLLGK
jgi:hypothetical protein